MKIPLKSVLFWLLLMPIITTTASGKDKQTQSSIQSPRLNRLTKEIQTAGQPALNTFLEEVQKQGTPLVEPIPGDETHVWVTFLWLAKEPVRKVVVFSGLTKH